MRTDKELDELYERSSPHAGWLSYLLEANAITKAEEDYLVWRDDCDAPARKALKLWERQIIDAGGWELELAETPEDKLRALDRRIREIDITCNNQPYALCEAIREQWNYRRLLSYRAQLRMQLEPPVLMPKELVDKARMYRLDDLLKSKLVKKFMKCPVHAEKHGSFFVTSYGYCFGCGKSWNAIGWLMDFENMTFKQAVEYLAGL